MNKKIAIGVAVGLSGICLTGSAFAFSSGSTSADGVLDVADNTVKVLVAPAGGIFNFTSVRVRTGATLQFDRDVTSAPVVMLVSGDVVIDSGGAIDVSGQTAPLTTAIASLKGTFGAGGPGGFNGGWGGRIDQNALKQRGGNGLGPGGGIAPPLVDANSVVVAGGGGFGTVGGGTSGGSAYGVPELLPLVGGSGGAGGRARTDLTLPGGGGGGGGGAILIAASGKITVSGQIRANGGAGAKAASPANWVAVASGGGGSGGAVHLMATEIGGAGSILATGGAAGDVACATTPEGSGGYVNHGSYVGLRGAVGANGRIYMQADKYSTLPTTNPFSDTGVAAPSNIITAGLPTVRIASVQNVDAPAIPKGDNDIHLAYGTASPVSVKIVTQGIAAGAKIVLTSVPRFGDKKVVTSDAIVPDANGHAELNLSIGIEPNQNTLFAITSN